MELLENVKVEENALIERTEYTRFRKLKEKHELTEEKKYGENVENLKKNQFTCQWNTR